MVKEIKKTKSKAKAKKTPSNKLANGNPKPEGYIFGRPTKYLATYCNDMVEYFKNAPLFEATSETYYDKNGNEQIKEVRKAAPQPSFIRFALSIGVDDATIRDWAETHKDFSRSKKLCHKIQEVWLSEAAGTFNYHPSIAIIQLKNNHNYTDTSTIKTENTNLNVETKADEKSVKDMTDVEIADLKSKLSSLGFNTEIDFLKDKEVKADE